MDNVVHNSMPPEEQERLMRFQEELEGQELTALLGRLQEKFDLSVNQIAIAAGMDESALHKILGGENREFKAEHVDALLDYLQQQGKLKNTYELAIWKRALRVSAHLHYDIYKAIEPRLRQIEDPVKRVEALKAYLREQYPALAETYDKSGGVFPLFIPLFDVVTRELNKRWDWVRIPFGYQLNGVKGNQYNLISTDLFPKKIVDLGSDLEVEDTGFGTYTIKRRIIQPQFTRITAHHSSDIKTNGIETKYFGGMEFMRVPGGKFLMGSTQENKLAFGDEYPQHTVDLPYDYWMARFPTTNEGYNKFVAAKGLKHPVNDWAKKKDHPVTYVKWDDAMAYCQWLNELVKSELPSGLVLRLPTEAEWEKAARWKPSPSGRGQGEGKALEWPWGNEFDKAKCNSSESGQGETTPVGSYSPQGDSPYGCADMAGNVWEWTHSYSLFKPYPYEVNDGREDEKDFGRRVLRGGAFDYSGWFVRCAYRSRLIPLNWGDNFGVRVVVSPFF